MHVRMWMLHQPNTKGVGGAMTAYACTNVDVARGLKAQVRVRASGELPWRAWGP